MSTTAGLSAAISRAPFDLRLDASSGGLIWAITASLFALFALVAPGFLTFVNLTSILSEIALFGFLAVALTPVIISGNIDISVGAVLGMAACTCISLMPNGMVTAISAALAAGLLVGLVNGLLMEKAGINSFIVTLATMIGTRGLTFYSIGDRSVMTTDPDFLAIGNSNIGIVPVRTVLLIAIAVLMGWMLRSTSHGRYTFAIGGNRVAAVDAGVRVSRHVIANMMICSLLAATGGVAMASQLGAVSPAFGAQYELWAITAVVLGGTRLRGGSGSILGSLGAVATLAMLHNGMILLQIQSFYIPIVIGCALILALVLDRQPIGLRNRE
ncbi:MULTISPECIES: ABC transporter permease [unclassified Mesorhizobium]|uniref:ABC transporter permease n=1 Tax=unclassified Mesorhizobium TaxID=325217 RepID=UPI000FDAF905|nr:MULTISPECIES: ABC transporter permease [unclassified Mesorhizobium]TGR23024.1 ABC transporter permease [Mesorhizobium sp. M8A.F.Ca.ET.197.01.1.1]TGR39110.1 ABC transporter permease [bacterium M00.F.Ca.ET.199.01.1.1]TGR46703.1 ABC transporter permease [Mesorhizobium sp. M8A.F.Ca.ET.198.01.1.1]TGV85223.1 ABC transporter permease [Mesorhizobium sp. M00.F.Ca.ET.149.01.1.1]